MKETCIEKLLENPCLDVNYDTVVITGICGQDGSYLAKYLLDKGYDVVGFTRRSGSSNFWRHKELGIHYHPKLKIEYVDITEYHNVLDRIKKLKPEYLFNLAAMSFVQTSFSQPFTTNDINYVGVLNLLSAIKLYSPLTKFYHASTSEMFGKVLKVPQNENTPFNPVSPYGISKLAAHYAVRIAREDGMFACSGILMNHESCLRGSEFITKKIAVSLMGIYSDIRRGFKNFDPLVVGNIYAKRDWGFAGDYVEGMWLMLQQKEPDDYVLATNITYSVKDFINEAWSHTSHIPLKWMNEGFGVEEYAVDDKGNTIVKISEEFYRPCEVDLLIGDYSKAKNVLGWEPKVTFKELVKQMMDYERAKTFPSPEFSIGDLY